MEDERLEGFKPRIIENREFVELEEEDIQKLNRSEAAKFEQNPDIQAIMARVARESGGDGHWDEHWVTLDTTGRRVYARVYEADNQTTAVAADGRIVRETELAENESKM